MAHRNRVKWEHGDLFAVPLADGSFGVVQAVDHWMPEGGVYAAVTDQRQATLPSVAALAPSARVIALIQVVDNAFDRGWFPRIGPAAALARRADFPNERFARSGYVEAKSYTAGIVVAFLSAWHGLGPWTPYNDPEFFDKLLVDGIERPSHVASGGR
jgi:hypothetical protein